MNVVWSLDRLYKSLDDSSFLNDLASYEKSIGDFCQWCEKNLSAKEKIKEKLETYINMDNEISRYSKLGAYCQLLLSVDSNNNEAAKHFGKLQEISTELVKPETMFINFIKDIDALDEVIAESELLSEHAFFLRETKKHAAYVLSEKEEEIISKFKNTGSSAWSLVYEQLTSQLTVKLGEEEMPLSGVRNLAYDESAQVRESAYYAECEALKNIGVPAAAALNAIKGEVITEYKLRGYESPLDMTLKNSRVEPETLSAMLQAINEYLPEFRKYLKRKAEIIGDSGGLKYYNLFAPVGKSELKFTYDEAADFIIEHFSGFSPELGDFAKLAFNKSWIDALPKPGKVGGAFCAGLHEIKESRVLSNFSGVFESVLTLAHELGHAYHNYCLKDETFLNSDYPMPIAETASTFCETLILKASLDKADEPAKLAILESSISGACQVIVDIYARYLFETSFFEKRKDGPLSIQEISDLMVDAQSESYGEGLEKSLIHPYMWIVKGHYYDAGFNFYNFPYAFGHLFCLGLFSMYLSEGASFAQTYKVLLKATGSNSLSEIGKLCGIDINSTEFWRSSLELIKNDISLFMEISGK